MSVSKQLQKKDEFVNMNIQHSSSVKKSIETLFEKEQIQGYKCEQCTATDTTIKRYSIDQPPKILCININRTNINGTTAKNPIDIPHTLSLKKFMNINQETNYKLRSIINHLGEKITQGHYITYIPTNKVHGIIINDDNISYLKREELETKNCYMLFYELTSTTEILPRINMLHTDKRFHEIKENINTENINPAEQNELNNLIKHYNDIFYLENDNLTVCGILKHNIPLYTDTVPINIRQYRRSQWENEEINKHVKKLLKEGIIRPSNSPFNSPALIVKKRDWTKTVNRKPD